MELRLTSSSVLMVGEPPDIIVSPFVPPAVLAFPQSGLDQNDMAVLAIDNSGPRFNLILQTVDNSQTLYWDYGNTEAFYIRIQPVTAFGITSPTLFRVSPQFAQQFYGTRSPVVIYNPFSYNQNRPSSRV